MMHRYPGPRSFTGDDRHLFFGRDAEKQELFRLIVLNDLVVLFGESGTGKTSLLQAGVCPDLEERQYKPVFIRLNNPDEAPELQVCRQLKEGGFLPADLPENGTLWEYFSRFWYVDLGEVYTPVIVFDQFEELFTLYQSGQRAAFIEQFSAIANRRPPAGLPPEAAAAPQAKFVFSLRSDFLYLLDELSADIPAILRCRFQLRLLDRTGAADAITKPAAMTGEYASPVFGYSPAALEGILGALSRANETSGDAATASHPVTTSSLGVTTGEIASFQLQLVCRQLEDKIIRQRQPAGFQVSPDFYGGGEGIRQIIEDFYHQVLEKVAPAERDAVEKLLARGLIRNGRRIMMEASAMRDEYGVPQAALELLHDERLLKREARKGELYYEISHDTLVKPVLERFKKIEEAERAAEAERLRLQAEEDKRRADEAERLMAEALEQKRRAEEEKSRAIALMSAVRAGEFSPDAVCRVVLENNYLGSGFLTTGNYLFTANYILPDKESATTARLELNFQRDLFGRPKARKIYKLDPDDFITSPTTELDFTRVKVIDDPEHPLSEWGVLRVGENVLPIKDEPVLIMHYPKGTELQITPVDTKVIAVWNDRLFYSPNTEPGSGGAPVLNRELKVIAIHEARKNREQGGLQINDSGEKVGASRGILMSAILGYIERMERINQADKL